MNLKSILNKKEYELIADCFYDCKIIAILVHSIAPEGCEMFREYLNLDDKLRMDFFKKHECQFEV